MLNETKSTRLRAGITKTILAGSLAVAMVPAWTSLDLAISSETAAVSPYSNAANNWSGKAFADETTFVVESAKDETVYAKTDATGKVSGIYVVNRFAAGDGVVMDPANYLSVSNMTTSDVLSQLNGKVEVPLQSAQPFYYEGEMAADAALPWNIAIKYFLDDKEVTPEELGGASGKLRIELSVTARTSAPETGVSDFANSYVMQAQGTFDSATFELDESDSLMVAQVGGEAVVNCMVLPGESKTFVLEGQANGFTSSGWQISALPLALAISIADQDTSQLTNATSQLENATGQLASGSEALAAGMDEAVSGVGKLSTGAGTLNSGVTELASGMSELSGSNDDLLEGWNQLAEGATALYDGTTELSEGSDTFYETVRESQEEMSGVSNTYSMAMTLYENALKRYASSPTENNKATLEQMQQMVILAAKAQGAAEALDSVLDGYEQIDDGIKAVSDGASELNSGMQEFEGFLVKYLDGVAAATEGVEALAEGITKLVQGTDQLSEGANELQEGAEALAEGSELLATSVKGMDAQLLSGIQQAIDEKLGADFELHSFVEPSNTSVGSVQFVYMVDGISVGNSSDVETDEVATVDSADAEDTGIIGRLIAWFTDLFA